MKISISGKHVTVFFLIILVAGGVYIIYRYIPKHTTTYNFFGIEIPFRVDIDKANNIPVYPDNETIYNIMWDSQVENITIAYVNSSENNKVAVEAFEITSKMKIAYQHIGYLNGVYLDRSFNGKEVDSYENISATPFNPVIVLIPPILSNDTLVMANNNVIYIKGTTMENFDLATVKFLMVALAINL